MGKTRVARVLPLFRSESQARVLAYVFLQIESRGAHLSEIARRTGLPFSTVQREVARLDEAGIVSSERLAQARLVRPNEQSPYFEEVRSLVLKAYGPATVLGELLAGVDRVEHAFIFGSWAARYEGQPGPPPADIDLLVVGEPDLGAVYAACEQAEERLGRTVSATIVSPEKWEAAESGFLRTVRDRPLVPLAIGEP